MFYRACLLLAAALFAGTALADAPPTAARWSAVAVPWNHVLPTVEVTAGYRDGYLPVNNFPIEISATAGTAAFDGYIGYRFNVGSRKTTDVPVIARAVIGQGRRWTFSTVGQMRGEYYEAASYVPFSVTGGTNRELVILWYDRSMKLVAQRNAGMPPWTRRENRRPLRIVAEGQLRVATRPLLGAMPLLFAPSELPLRAQWYAGFTAIAAPLELWLDLPLPLRQTIFHAPATVFLFGVPRQGQQLTEIDRALLPIELVQQPAEIEVPRDYQAGRATISLPVTWRAKPGAVSAGAGEVPYLVTSPLSAFGADERASEMPLPAGLTEEGPGWMLHPGATAVRGRLTAALEQFRPGLATIGALVVAIACWLLLRRNRIAFAVVIAGAALVTTVGFRASLRRNAGNEILSSREWIAPDVVIHTITERPFGWSPIAAAAVDAREAASWTAFPQSIRQSAELRQLDTLPGHGAMFDEGPWDNSQRHRRRREIASPPDIRVRSVSDTAVALEGSFVSSINYAEALWVGGDRLRLGEVPVDSDDSQLTIRQEDRLTSLLPTWEWTGALRDQRPSSSAVRMILVSRKPQQTTVDLLDVPQPAAATMKSLQGAGRIEAGTEGPGSMWFVMPRAVDIAEGTEVAVNLRCEPAGDVHAASITASNGIVDLMSPPARRVPAAVPGQHQFRIPYESLRAIAAPGDVLRIDVVAPSPVEHVLVALATATTRRASK